MPRHKKTRRQVLIHNSPKRRLSPQWYLLGSVALVVVIIVVLIIRNGISAQNSTSPQVVGAPRLVVDQDTIDHGNLNLGSTVTTVFHIRNVGDQPLTILNVPKVQVVMGCCPPPVTLSSNVIQPGQEATVSLTYMMHTGMGGKHRFNIDLQTNDPTQPTKQLVTLSNWI